MNREVCTCGKCANCHTREVCEHNIPDGDPCEACEETLLSIDPKDYQKEIDRRDEEIKKLKETISKLQIDYSRGWYTPLHETERKKALADNESQRMIIGKLVDESQKVINWFEALGNKQKDLLVKHQSLETASKNWEEAAGLDNLNSLDFQPMMDLIAEARKFQEGK